MHSSKKLQAKKIEQQAFTKERAAENAYRHFQKKYKKRKDKGWRNMGPMREEELLRLENCEARMTSLVEITKPRTRAGGRHCIHGGRKECPDVGFQRRGSGKEACALLAKLVT